MDAVLLVDDMQNSLWSNLDVKCLINLQSEGSLCRYTQREPVVFEEWKREWMVVYRGCTKAKMMNS
ncbi:lipid A phosphoethanolamine transferase, partial [Escherichia coli]